MCRCCPTQFFPTLGLSLGQENMKNIAMRPSSERQGYVACHPRTPWSDGQSLSSFRTCICIQDLGQEITSHDTWLRPKEMFATQTPRTTKKYGAPSTRMNLSNDSLFVRRQQRMYNERLPSPGKPSVLFYHKASKCQSFENASHTKSTKYENNEAKVSSAVLAVN